jgi:hypothetical protein
MSAASNTIRWFVKESFDEPKLRSPQPCVRGIHCDFKRWCPETKHMEPAVCHFVHPGEEGAGRRYFPARQLGVGADARQQPACVRLTGAAQGFYERCGRKLPWGVWCAEKGIPYTPVVPGAKWEPVTIERIGAPRTPQRPKVERPPPMAPKRSVHSGGGSTLTIQQWLTTATPEEMEDYYRHCDAEEHANPGADCNYCHPSSGCDGDHGDEMRDGFIIRKPALLAYAREAAAAAEQASALEIPDANGRIWYDSKTPVGALAQALMACEKLEESWSAMLKPLVDASTPEELATELGPADVANIKNTPFHYATHLLGRAQRIRAARKPDVDALLSDIASAGTNEEYDRLRQELEALVDE